MLAKGMGRGVGRAQLLDGMVQLRKRKQHPLGAWRVVATVRVAASKFFGGKQLDSQNRHLCRVGWGCPWFEF